jgi:hypothetical protein
MTYRPECLGVVAVVLSSVSVFTLPIEGLLTGALPLLGAALPRLGAERPRTFFFCPSISATQGMSLVETVV